MTSDDARQMRAWAALDPQVAAYVRDVYAPSVMPTDTLTVGQLRDAVRSRALATRPEEIHSIEDVLMNVDGDYVRGRIYRPTPRPSWVIVYFHGGGWVTGNLDTADAVVRRLANLTGAEVVSVDYRLAPEHPFPAAVEDAFRAVRWARGLAADRPLAVAGDSAGGNLAAVCALGQIRAAAGIDAQLLCYPVVDANLERHSYAAVPGAFPLGNRMMAWYWDRYVPRHDVRSDPRAAPLRSTELNTAAPAVVVLAGQDPLLDEGRAYATALNLAAVPVVTLEYHGAVHGFLGLPDNFALRNRAWAQAAAALEAVVFS